MELPRRKANDIYLPDGTFRRTVSELSARKNAADLRIGIVYAFDFRTRMLPYWFADKRMAPCSVRTLADVLAASGFNHTRVILQQWTPNFKASLAEIDGKPLDILLVSAMQVHSEPSYDVIRDAHQLGENRPLILAGGPKAIYEPTDYFEIGPKPGIGADCSFTGEAFILLDFLNTILEDRGAGESARESFERARLNGALENVPGIVYLDPDSDPQQPRAISTGIQRLLRDLDEMPMPDAGYRVLEKPHRGSRLRAKPASANSMWFYSPIASVISTQGCKFNCSYCPIPAVNQRTWRHKSPQRLAAEIQHIRDTFGIRDFFSTDDNFFNSRETVVELMTEMARVRTEEGRLGRRIRFYTEATEFDVYKNRDILPLCRKGGLRGIWFGIEDIMADLVNKGQTAGKTSELFKELWDIGIEPMAMMIHSDDQPVDAKGELSGLLDQARYLFEKGAVSYQCTYLGPAVGTRDFEPSLQNRTLFKTVGGDPIPQAYFDGNHVVASKNPNPAERQMNVLKAYSTFYNPKNTLRAILGLNRNAVSQKRLLFQFIGLIGLMMTYPKLAGWARKLRKGQIVPWDGLQPARIPMIDITVGKEVDWAIQSAPVGSAVNGHTQEQLVELRTAV
jgi:radical SAM superfamily enzyme YgiQ (UPF0313 family)